MSLENSKFPFHESKKAAFVLRLWVALVAEVLKLSRNVNPTCVEGLELILNDIMGRLVYFSGQVVTKSVDSINFGSVFGSLFAFDLQHR